MKTWLLIYAFTAKQCYLNLYKLNLGDQVIWRGRVCIIGNGVSKPLWTLYGPDPFERYEYIHQDQFKKTRSLRNLWNPIRSTWRFYKDYWWSIWRYDISKMKAV